MKEVSAKEYIPNPFTAFSDDWMALTAGNEKDGFNSMTIAWGHFGSLWERGTHTNRLSTVVCYVRPGHYTKAFMDNEEYFTLSCFDKDYKKALVYLGTHSGRDEDKVKPAGLTPVFAEGITYFAEAKVVYVCRKLYHAPIQKEGFADKKLIDFNYPNQDFHEMYVGEIVKMLVRTESE